MNFGGQSFGTQQDTSHKGLTQPLNPQSNVGTAPTTKIEAQTVQGSFVVLSAIAQIVCIALFFHAKPTSGYWTADSLADSYGDGAKGGVPIANIQLYNNYIGVTLMMFIGFGYLMTFLKNYGLGALGLTMYITCLGMQWGILCWHYFGNWATGESSPLTVDVFALLQGDFAVAAFLISFGGIIGKANPTQLLILVLFEGVFYAFNLQFVLTKHFAITDCGGTIIIHMFGAYFGLAVAAMLGKPNDPNGREGSTQVSDIFSLVGTLFLWLYWPSFVAGALPAGTVEADTAITNTVLALLGSTVTTFIISAALNGNVLRPVDIQNATLAGGVSIGALANLNLTPGYALVVGSAAGLLSTFGFCKVQDALCSAGLHDSCGIHNLHGMPSLLGGLLSAWFPMFLPNGDGTGAWGNSSNQMCCIYATLAIAIGSGLLTGGVMRAFKDQGEAFNDAMYWEVAEE